MKSLNEHDLSRNECFKLFSVHNNLVEFGRPVRCVNVLGTRIVDTDNIDDEETNNRCATKTNFAEFYWARETDPNYQALVQSYEDGTFDYPDHPKDISLYQFASRFTKTWTLNPRLHFVHPTPLFRYPPLPAYEDYRRLYCETTLLLYKPGTNRDNLSDDLEAELHTFINEDNCPRLIKEEYIKSLQTTAYDDQEDDPDDDLLPSPLSGAPPPEIEQDPWLRLGGQMTNDDVDDGDNVEDEDVFDAINEYENLTTDPIDWFADYRELGYSDDDLKAATDWIDRMKVITTLEQSWDREYDSSLLNERQKKLFHLLKAKIDSVAEGAEAASLEQVLIDVMGGGGSGKTFVVKTILQYCERRIGKRGLIRVVAPTNSAAGHYLDGYTLHRLFKLPVSNKAGVDGKKDFKDLSGASLYEMQEILRDCFGIIIDEKSMMSLEILFQVDQRLKQARPSRSKEPFGGFSIVLVGDIFQLPPVGGRAIYTSKGGSKYELCGRLLYRLFNTSICLNQSMRQAGSENEVFRNQLDGLAKGTFSRDDWESWGARELSELDQVTRNLFRTTATKLCAYKADMTTFNVDGLRSTGNPLLVVKAKNNPAGASVYSSDKAQGLTNCVPLTKGCSVILTMNLWPEAKLVNGSRGEIRYIIFRPGCDPFKSLPEFVIVHFPKYIGPEFIPGQPGTVPIFPQCREWMIGENKFSRKALPLLLGYAVTIHRSQGMTIDRVILNVGPKEFASGITYTGASRVKGLHFLAFDPLPSFDRIQSIFGTQAFKEKLKEFECNLAMAESVKCLIRLFIFPVDFFCEFIATSNRLA